MPVRGVRGATTAKADESDVILAATRALLESMLAANPGLSPDEVASVLFTVTSDLTAAYPAAAARKMGWDSVPLMCAREIDVPGGLPRCIRVLLHWNTDLKQAEVRHVYLGEAERLRPDLQNQREEF